MDSYTSIKYLSGGSIYSLFLGKAVENIIIWMPRQISRGGGDSVVLLDSINMGGRKGIVPLSYRGGWRLCSCFLTFMEEMTKEVDATSTPFRGSKSYNCYYVDMA